MKFRNYYIALTLIVFSCPSCKKEILTASGSAALNIVNVVNGSYPLVANFTPKNAQGKQLPPLVSYNTANQIAYGSSYESGSYLGNTYLSTAQISDTLKNLWAGSLNLPVGSIHTLFLSGDTTATDTVFTGDLVPYYPPTDSVAGVRFINLVQGSQPVSINIQGNPSKTEFLPVGYRKITPFKSYPANSAVPGYYTFEIRDQATGSLLQTYTWNYAVCRSQTLVIFGQAGAQSIYPISVFPVNDY